MATAGNITAVLTLNASGFKSGLDSSLGALDKFQNSIAKFNANSRTMGSAIDTLFQQLERLNIGLKEFNQSITNLSKFSQLSTAINKMANGLKILSSETVNVDQGINTMNNIFKAFQGTLNGTTVKVEGLVNADRQLSSANSQLASSQSQVASTTNQEVASVERDSVAKTKASASTQRLASANKTLGNSLSMLKNAFTLVGSMIAYNFIHNLGTAVNETINAKSEMNGYFQMLGYTTGQVKDFNSALDKTVEMFPRLNKYALGETISSIGVEFELTTQEMKKAMPVVSMITSEYLRAGRNVNEASLAVKDILQGEFQRLSRETGVKADQLKEAGWSGDKSDVMGLLKALDKVGKSRNWDTFVTKANSLNDAVLILQNRFSEWSADMVEKVQPTIVSAFNTIMQVGSSFGEFINGIIDWLGGDGLGQAIAKWGGLATILGTVTLALIHYRTGANLVQIAQMGLTRSIGATILGLEGETVAEYGLRNSITASLTGIEAQKVAEEGRLASILASISGLEAEEVAEIGKTKVLFASILGLDTATLKEYGFATALAHATTQIEAQELKSMGLIKKIALIGATTIPAIAVVGAFAVAFGKLALETMEATERMSKFYDIQQHGKEYVDEARESVETLKEKQQDLIKTQKKYTKGSEEYKNVGKAIDSLDDKLELAKSNIDANYEALQRVNSAQENYDTTKLDAQLELQRKINQSLVDTGLSTKEANELSNDYLNDAIDGSNQLYEALQSVVYQYGKEAEGVAGLTEYWENQGLDAEAIKVKVDPYIDAQSDLAEDIEKMKLSTNLIEVTSAWLEVQYDQIKLSFSENLPKIEAGDWEGGISGLLKGLAHGLADLPVFKDFWGYIFDHFKIKETYGGKGWEGLNQFLTDATNNLKQWTFDWFKDQFDGLFDESWGWDPLKDFTRFLYDVFHDFDLGKAIMDGLNSNSVGWDPVKDFTNWVNDKLSPLKDIDIFGMISNAFSSWFDGSGGGSGGTTNGMTTKKINFGSILKGIFDLGSFDLGAWFEENIAPIFANFDLIGSITGLIFGNNDGSTDPNDVSWINNILPIEGIKSWFSNFATDPLGTLGIDLSGLDPTSWFKGFFDISGLVSQFTLDLSSIIPNVSNTVSNVGSMFSGMRDTIRSHLSNVVSNVSTGFESVKNNAVSKITAMRDSVKGVIDQMTQAWTHMKDSILNSAKLIYDGVKKKFDDVGNTLKDFFGKLQDPSKWGAGHPSMSRSPRPATARRLFGRVTTMGGGSSRKSGAGISPYTKPNQKVRLGDLIDVVGTNKEVTLSDFLSMFSEGGFGGWDFHEPYKTHIFNKGKQWKSGSPTIKGIGTIDSHYKVERFWNGKPSFSWDEFLTVAEAIFSTIPYRFYYDSEWKGSWLGALLSGAVNCSDGADALIALASVFGFSGSKVHTTTKNGIGHFYANINGHNMDTTNFQNNRSWSPLGGAGVPTRSSGTPMGKTVNVNVDMSNSTIYGVDDLDSKIQESVQKGLQQEFNDPYTVAI